MSKAISLGGLFLVTLALIGCSAQSKSSTDSGTPAAGTAEQRVALKQDAGPAVAQAEKAGNGKNDAAIRRVIYTAHLDVVVADFDKARKVFEKLIEDSEAYVAKSDFSGHIGARRSGSWIIRVPVPKFHSFVHATAALGQPQRHSTEAQDVTEEYVDVQALIKNLKEEEETLNRLLKEQAKNFADVQLWRDKIAAIRRDIGRYEARLQTLGRLSAMSTVHVTLRDENEYVPETTPRYGASPGKTFDDSWKTFKEFGEWVLIVLVALVPWLPIVILLSLIMWRWWKHAAARNRPTTGPESGERLIMP